MFSRLPDLRTHMFDGNLDTFEASSSTVLVHCSAPLALDEQLGNNDALIAQPTNSQPAMAAIRVW
jgi:hypothetical protein